MHYHVSLKSRESPIITILHMCFYLTAFADRFLVVSKESIMTPQGGLGGCRGLPPGTAGGTQIAWDILAKSLLALPELHSRATF